jgi:hypothetical protein
VQLLQGEAAQSADAARFRGYRGAPSANRAGRLVALEAVHDEIDPRRGSAAAASGGSADAAAGRDAARAARSAGRTEDASVATRRDAAGAASGRSSTGPVADAERARPFDRIFLVSNPFHSAVERTAMSSQRIFGLILLVVGALLLLLGLNATDSVTESVKEGVTGRYTETTTWYLVGGGAMALLGLALTVFGGGGRVHSA